MNQIEEHFYETAAQEVATKQVVPGLMAKAFSECDGDERRTIARYIKYRVAQLQEQFASEKAWRTEQEKQRQAQEKKKAEEERRQQESRDQRKCPNCSAKYRRGEYSVDAPVWLCSFCKHILPRE